MANSLNYLQQYLVDEFLDDYQEMKLSRREALHRIANITGSFAVAGTLLAACSPAAAPAPQAAPTPLPPAATTAPTVAPTAAPASAPAGPGVAANDPTIQAQAVSFPGEGATIMGYVARPAADGVFPAVLVCHENRGLTDHIKDVTRRLAKSGYVGLSVDLLSREGGTDKVDPARAGGILSAPAKIPSLSADFQAGWKHLQEQSYVNKQIVGMVGFCFGGGVTWLTATKMPELKAAVPYYGPNPPLADVPNIRAAVLAMYGETDTRINSGIPAIEEEMKKQNKTFEKMIYPGAGHAFNNDTGGSYRADQAREAWAKTIAWFDKYLKV